MKIDIYLGDCLDSLKKLEDQSINTCITSPPYFALRDYGVEGQLGLEETPKEFIDNLVNVFKEVKRVLRDDGTVWLNIGDSYGNEKHLLGIPWRVAFAMQDDDWILRQDIIWNKPNPMPESVKDRCTKAHEYIFLFSKSKKYYFDNEVIKEESVTVNSKGEIGKPNSAKNVGKSVEGIDGFDVRSGFKDMGAYEKKNKRSVWTVATKPFTEAHFATFPKELILPCVLAGCPEGGTVLDPFAGSGTTGIVANHKNRNAILLELSEDYINIAVKRIRKEVGTLFLNLNIIRRKDESIKSV
tara:strand:+ start:805 stop:1698 length:894 start_codon:yes stop_codon:yes gene_type:complete